MHTDTSQERDSKQSTDEGIIHLIPRSRVKAGILVTLCGVDKAGCSPKWDCEPNCVVCLEMSKHRYG